MKKCRFAPLLAVFAAATSGCYTTRPIGPAPPAPDTRIVARLTDQGTAEMGNTIGSGAVLVEGLVVRADPTLWEVRLLRVQHRDGVSVRWAEEPVSFQRNFLEAPTEKKLDRPRSWLTAGAAVVALVLAGRIFLDVTSAGEDSGGGEPAPEN